MSRFRIPAETEETQKEQSGHETTDYTDSNDIGLPGKRIDHNLLKRYERLAQVPSKYDEIDFSYPWINLANKASFRVTRINIH